MGTMVKMYIHVLFVDIHDSPLFRKCESDFINKTIKCSNALLISDIGIYVTRKKYELYNLDQELSQSQNNCLSPDCQYILVHFLRCLALI